MGFWAVLRLSVIGKKRWASRGRHTCQKWQSRLTTLPSSSSCKDTLPANGTPKLCSKQLLHLKELLAVPLLPSSLSWTASIRVCEHGNSCGASHRAPWPSAAGYISVQPPKQTSQTTLLFLSVHSLHQSTSFHSSPLHSTIKKSAPDNPCFLTSCSLLMLSLLIWRCIKSDGKKRILYQKIIKQLKEKIKQ